MLVFFFFFLALHYSVANHGMLTSSTWVSLCVLVTAVSYVANQVKTKQRVLFPLFRLKCTETPLASVSCECNARGREYVASKVVSVEIKRNTLGFGTEPIYKSVSMMLTVSLFFLQRMNRCLLFEWGWHWLLYSCCIDWWLISGLRGSDRQPDHPVYILPALPLSLLNDGFISLPCLNASWGFDALHAKNTVKKGGEQKITYLALWRMEIWTELKLKHSALTFTHKKQTTVNGCLQTISSFLLRKGHSNVFSSSPQHFLNCF